jgi:hypothetical protein
LILESQNVPRQVKKRSLDPVWGQIFVFEVADPMKRGCGKATFAVMDWDRMTKDDQMGWVEVCSEAACLPHVFLFMYAPSCDA